MIIPTPEFDSRVADDGTPFRDKMIRWIEKEFRDLLGENARLLHLPEGLEKIQAELKRPLPIRQAA